MSKRDEPFAATSFTVAGLREAVGVDLGASRWIEVDQARIDAFAAATEDHQWIHIDPARAASGPFGTTIAHGYLTLSLVAAFLNDLIDVTDARMAVNYGLDRVRFPAPVPSGSRVRGHGVLVEAQEVPGGTQLVVRLTVEREQGDKPACVADFVARYYA